MKIIEVALKPPSKGLFSENLVLNWSFRLRHPLLADMKDAMKMLENDKSFLEPDH